MKPFATAQLSSLRARFAPMRRRQFRFNATSAVPKSVTYGSRQVPKCRVWSRLCKDEASTPETAWRMWQRRERLPCIARKARRLQLLETTPSETDSGGDTRKSPAQGGGADATSMRGGSRAGYTKLRILPAGARKSGTGPARRQQTYGLRAASSLAERPRRPPRVRDHGRTRARGNVTSKTASVGIASGWSGRVLFDRQVLATAASGKSQARRKRGRNDSSGPFGITRRQPSSWPSFWALAQPLRPRLPHRPSWRPFWQAPSSPALHRLPPPPRRRRP